MRLNRVRTSVSWVRLNGAPFRNLCIPPFRRWANVERRSAPYPAINPWLDGEILSRLLDNGPPDPAMDAGLRATPSGRQDSCHCNKGAEACFKTKAKIL